MANEQQWPGPAPAGAPAAKKSGSPLIIGLVIAAVCAVPVVGILAAIAIPNFVRYTQRAKESEAQANLRMLASAEQAYFEEHKRFLPAGPTPAEVPRGQPAPATFTGNFQVLGFQPPAPVRFQYQAKVQGSTAVLTATGDLDGDGMPSEWTLEVRPGESGSPKKSDPSEF